MPAVKPMPRIQQSFRRLYDMLHGAIEANLLVAAIELRVFTLLEAPKSAAGVAAALGTHPDNTRYMLDALAALGLLHKSRGIYSNAADCADFLVEGRETYLGELFLFQDKGANLSPARLVELVEKGPAGSANDLASDDAWATLTHAAANYQRSGYAQQIADLVERLPEFPRFRRLLDLGGGAGLVGMAIATRAPDLSGVLFEQPQVAAVAREYLAEYGLGDRYRVIAGDFTTDDIGSGYDFVWAGATLNFAGEKLDAVVGKVHDSLAPGGVFVSFHEALRDERTQPRGVLLDMLAERLTHRDWSNDWGWVAEAMVRAGFRTVQSRPIEATIGEMGLDIGRKAAA